MKKNSSASLLPAAVQPLHQLGQHIRAARQARGWTIAETAARAVMSPATYKRIEAGDCSVSMTSWANVLAQFRLLEQWVAALAPAQDRLGEVLRAEQAVKRVRKPKGQDDYDF